MPQGIPLQTSLINKAMQGANQGIKMVTSTAAPGTPKIPDWLVNMVVPPDATIDPSDAMSPMGSVMSKGLGPLGKLGKALLQRFKGGPTTLGRLTEAAPKPMPTLDSRITGLEPAPTTALAQASTPDKIGDDHLFEVLRDRMEQRRVRDIANPPQPRPNKPVNPNQSGGAGQKGALYGNDKSPIDTKHDEVARDLTEKLEDTGYATWDQFKNRHEPSVGSGTAVVPPKTAKEMSRLMGELMDEGSDLKKAWQDLWPRYGRTMGHIDKIRFGDDALQTTKNPFYLGYQQSAAHDLLDNPPKGLMQGYHGMPIDDHLSTIAINPTAMYNVNGGVKGTLAHELTHVGQQLRHGDKFYDKYEQGTRLGEVLGSYYKNPWEARAAAVERNKTIPKSLLREERIRRRLAKIFPNIDADGDPITKVPTDVLATEQNTFNNMLNQYLGKQTHPGSPKSPEEVRRLFMGLSDRLGKRK